MSNEIIAFTGPIAAGKDTAAKYLSDRFEIPIFRISDSLKEIAWDRGIEPTRQNLVAIGRKVAQRRGDEYLAELVLDKAPQQFIVTGIRQLGQIALFGSHRLQLLSIDADPDIRFERAALSGKIGEALTLEEFVRNETSENSSNVQRLQACMDIAEHHIPNNGSREELYDRLDELRFTRLD